MSLATQYTLRGHNNIFLIESIQNQCREDYRELLDLTVIFLGAIPLLVITFRFLVLFIMQGGCLRQFTVLKYLCFKINFNLKPKKKIGFREICIFLVHSYVEAWFRAPLTTEASLNDFKLFKNFTKYPGCDISRMLINKLCGHLWYLASENMTIAFF